MPSSSSPWQQSPPWRRLRTTTHLCSLWTSRQTSTRSSTLSRSCTTLTSPKLTHSSGKSLNPSCAECQFQVVVFFWADETVLCTLFNTLCIIQASTVITMVVIVVFVQEWTIAGLNIHFQHILLATFLSLLHFALLFCLGLMVRRRRTFVSHQITMRWMLQTRWVKSFTGVNVFWVLKASSVQHNGCICFQKFSILCKWCKLLFCLNVYDAFKGTTDAR